MLNRLVPPLAPTRTGAGGRGEDIHNVVRSEIADLFAAARSFDTHAPAEEPPPRQPSPPPLRAATRMATVERSRGAVGVLANAAPLRGGSSSVQHTSRDTEAVLQRLGERGAAAAVLASPAAAQSEHQHRDFALVEEDGPVVVLERLRLLARRFTLWRLAVWLPKRDARLLRVRSAAADRSAVRAAWCAWRRHVRDKRLLDAHSERLRRSASTILQVWQVWASARQEVRQALHGEVARLNEELSTARELVEATQEEVALVRTVGDEREGSLRLEMEQRVGAVRLELEQQKAIGAQTIDELSGALETASTQLATVHRERDVAMATVEDLVTAAREREVRERDTRPRSLRTRTGGISGEGHGSATSSPAKPAKLPAAVMSSAGVLAAAVPMLPEDAQAEIDAVKEKARLSIKKVKSEADRRVSRVEADAVTRVAAAERKAAEAASFAEDERIELEVGAKKKEEVLRRKLKRSEQELVRARKMTEAARAERKENEREEARAAKKEAAAEEKWARQLARQESEWKEKLDTELDVVRRSRVVSEAEQRAAKQLAQQEAEALSNTTSALARLLAQLQDVLMEQQQAEEAAAGSGGSGGPASGGVSKELRSRAVEELRSARSLLEKHRGDDERELRRARIWFAKQLEELEEEAALKGEDAILVSSRRSGGQQRRRISPDEVRKRLFCAIVY
jgi:hypothetical protein